MLMYRHLLQLARKHDLFVITDDNPKVRHLPLPCKGIRLKDKSQNLLRRIARRLGFEVLWILIEARSIKKKTKKILKKYKPDLILTIWHSPFLLSAADLAEKFKVPYVVIIHDDWEQMGNDIIPFRKTFQRKLRSIFRNAKARLCVSEGMKKELINRYGNMPCEILPPIPSKNQKKAEPAWKKSNKLRIGFFGDLGGNLEVLNKVADVLAYCNATLSIFSHGLSVERRNLASRPNVFDKGFLSPTYLRKYFQENIDVVLIPQSFTPAHKGLMKTNFPSKLLEACSFGLPILIVAPHYASAYQWAKTRFSKSCLIEKLDHGLIRKSLLKMKKYKYWRTTQKKVLDANKEIMFLNPDKILEKALDLKPKKMIKAL